MSHTGTEAGRLIVEELYERIRSRHIRYGTAQWTPGVGQRLRDPGWVLRPGEPATCVDLALLFAALCLRERLAPYIVLLRDRDTAHALVGVDLAGIPTASDTRGSCWAAAEGSTPPAWGS